MHGQWARKVVSKLLGQNHGRVLRKRKIGWREGGREVVMDGK